MGALTIGFMGNAEQASITNAVLANVVGNGQATLTVQNTGSASVTISSATIDGNAATITTNPSPILKGTIGTVIISYTTTTLFVNTAQYTIKLMTAKGNTLTTQATYSGP